LHYAVLRLPDCVQVGHVSLTLAPGAGESASGAQLGFAIDPTHRRRGYAVRACLLACAAARRLGLAQLSASASARNEASRRTLARIGALPLDAQGVASEHELLRFRLRLR
jgi:RimJ/RimL family protein N-acetyltransferase